MKMSMEKYLRLRLKKQAGVIRIFASGSWEMILSINKLYKAFLQELDELGIPYTEKRTMQNDIPRFDEP